MRVAVILTARPSYAKMRPIIAALLARGVDVQVVACASALLERYGRCVDMVRRDFPGVDITECWTTYEGSTLLTSAKETGALLTELSVALSRMAPDAAIVMADRHEVLAAAQAVSYLHIPLAHAQGGEKSGSIDDKVRDAITHLADYHFVCTELAQFRVYGLTGRADRVFNVGCPSIDIAKQAIGTPPVTAGELGGAGAPVDLGQPFLVVVQHSVTSEAEHAAEQMRATLEAVKRGIWPAIVLWPGQDAGAEAMSKVIREHQLYVHTVRNLAPPRFLRLLAQCAALVGNSSAGIREASFLGAPVVNIGTRQHGRQRAENVVDVAHDPVAIMRAIARQVEHGRYPSSTLYGSGDAAEKIANALVNLKVVAA